MENYSEYLLKVSLGLAVEYLFYKVFLSRLTYYQWNRVYLLLYTMMAFVIPLIDLGPTIKRSAWSPGSIETVASLVPIAKPVVSNNPVFVAQSSGNISVVEQDVWATGLLDVLPWIYLAGILVFTGRLVLGFIAVNRLKGRSEKIREGGLSLYVSKMKIAPFAFGKSVFFDENDYASANKDAILMHEEVHVRQRHSLDTIFAELLVAFNWYNPFAWLIRRTIRQNLEFIADQELLNRGIELREYQYMLLELAGYTPYFFGNQFTFSSLKERIKMMNRLRSARIHLAKFLVLVPVVTISLTMCQKSDVDNKRGSERQTFMFYPKDQNTDVFSGIVVDAQTLKPIEKFRIKLLKLELTSPEKVMDKVRMRSIGQVVDSVYIETDANGYYYWKNPDPSEDYDYRMSADEPGYHSFGIGSASRTVAFVQPITAVGHSEIYFLDNGSEHATETVQQNRESLRRGLLECAGEFKLISDFKKTRFHSGRLITHFRNAYFDSEDELLGYEGNVDFYLDGEKTTYDVLNSTFEWQAPSITKHVRPASHPLTKQHREFSYYSAPLSRDAAPHRNLVTPANFEVISGFDLSRLNSEPYYLDGFRQIKGIGSNLKPEIHDIKRVILLKGRLARYYNNRLDKILWIETRPKNEIPGRPEF